MFRRRRAVTFGKRPDSSALLCSCVADMPGDHSSRRDLVSLTRPRPACNCVVYWASRLISTGEVRVSFGAARVSRAIDRGDRLDGCYGCYVTNVADQDRSLAGGRIYIGKRVKRGKRSPLIPGNFGAGRFPASMDESVQI